jgi:phenylacetate-CoA ligase
MSVNDRPYFQPDLETLPAERLREIQLDRFRRMIRRAMEECSFYAELYRKEGVEPEEIRSLEDVRKVPLLDRERLRRIPPSGLICAPTDRIREIHSTSGRQRRRPMLVAATQQDIDYWADLNARSLWMIGLRPGDVLLNTYPMGMTTRGFGLHYGALKLGMVSIPSGPLSLERLVDLLVEARVTGICGSSSMALNLANYVERRKIPLQEKASCRVALLGSEPWSRATRERIQETLGLKAYDHYGMNELLGPGMGCECQVRDRSFGMHTWADAFLCECIDPRTGDPVPDEEEGELVWTSLVWEGTPLIRYRSGDLSAITWRPCDCGRSHPRLAPIIGRTEDAVAIEGILLYPSQVEETLLAFEEAGSQFRIVVDRDRKGGDYFILRVELKDRSYLRKDEARKALARKMKEAVRQATGLAPREVDLVCPGGLKKTGGSEEKTAAVRVEDRRPKDPRS